MGLPKKELNKFSGDPMDYWGFIRSSISSVDRYTDDFVNRLSYPFQYCDGEALDAIEGCTVLETESGYNEVISILQRRIGLPYVIAGYYIRSLTEGRSLRQDDAKDLTDLAEKIKRCATTLRQLHYESDVKSCRTLGDIVRRLLTPMQSKWFEVATNILRHDREPSFTDLTSISRHVPERPKDRSVVKGLGTPVERPSCVDGTTWGLLWLADITKTEETDPGVHHPSQCQLVPQLLTALFLEYVVREDCTVPPELWLCNSLLPQTPSISTDAEAYSIM
ncbi:hypothetical protein EG68_12464 [Paragonimus skrjabini miyazakii]|uniref:Uncharacterized protein n=1 Tax=Paragonimus skrjabini miyazakii TaxID=59628 RepID=A0A8S9YJV5_9TREM|nr:hypothetical protein EG68_12464 [Paragonimus skrjabini miyazakii]